MNQGSTNSFLQAYLKATTKEKKNPFLQSYITNASKINSRNPPMSVGVSKKVASRASWKKPVNRSVVCDCCQRSCAKPCEVKAAKMDIDAASALTDDFFTATDFSDDDSYTDVGNIYVDAATVSDTASDSSMDSTPIPVPPAEEVIAVTPDQSIKKMMDCDHEPESTKRQTKFSFYQSEFTSW